MKKKTLNKFMKDPYFLAAIYCKMKNNYLDQGFDEQSSSLSASLAMVPAFAGKSDLSIVELDKYARIIVATVDAVLYSKN